MPRMLALIIAVSVLPGLVHAGVYIWIDASGVAHFSDYPPGKLPHQKLVISPPSTVPMSENLKQGRRMSDIRNDVRGLLSEPGRRVGASAEATGASAQHAKTCDAYRRKLDRIQSKLRAGYGNDKGNTLRRQRRTTSQKLSRECLLQ